jgi:hypothetical protein
MADFNLIGLDKTNRKGKVPGVADTGVVKGNLRVEGTLEAPILTDSGYQGTWNASTNTPTLTSSTGTQGHWYLVDTAGSTTLNGVSTWAAGDVALFNGSVWQKVQNSLFLPIGTGPDEIPLNRDLGSAAYIDAAETPAAALIPQGQSDGRISPNWIQGSLQPVQAVENISATTGMPFADTTQSAWSAQMTERFTFFVPTPRTTEIQLVRNGNFGAYLATDGKFRINYGGTYQTVQPITTSNDWVDVIFSYADNGTSAVTFDVTVNGVDFGTQQVVTYSDEFIRSIWASDYGFLHVASMGYGHLTNTATTKMNNYGDACGSLPSVAGSSVVLAQATSTARPLIGRVPVGGRYNTLINTKNLSASSWNLKTSNVIIEDLGKGEFRISDTVTAGAELFRWGRVLTSGQLPFTDPSPSVIQIDVKPDGWDEVYFSLRSSSFTAVSRRGASFALSGLGTVITGVGTITLLDDGFYRCSFTHPNNSSASQAQSFCVFFTADTSYVGDGTKSLIIRNPQIRITANTSDSVVKTPQVIGATLQDATLPNIPDQEYLFFDRADDILAGTVSAITGGEIIFAGRNGIWHDSLTVSAGTWQIGATTYTGGPAGLLAVVGDYICSAVISGRAFTTEERDAIYALARARGAPGVFSIDPTELVTNGTFDTDTDWTKGTGWAIGSGVATKTAGSAGSLSQAKTLVASTAYYYTVDVTRSAGTLTPRFTGGTTVTGTAISATETRRGVLTAVTGNTAFEFNGDAAFAGTVDNVSLKAITLTPWS